MIKPKDIQAAITAFKAALRADVVSATEVEKRLTICNKCPKRQVTRGVSNASYVLGMLANRHRVPRDIAGYSCSICGCSLLMLLPAKKEDLHVDSIEEAKNRPKTCWIHESIK